MSIEDVTSKRKEITLKVVHKGKLLERYNYTENFEHYTLTRFFCNDPEEATRAHKEISTRRYVIDGQSCFIPICEIFHYQDDDICWICPRKNDLQSFLTHQAVKVKQTLEISLIITHMYTLALGLKILFDNNLLHGALCPSNIYMVKGLPKITGFHLFHAGYTNMSTKWSDFVAPEAGQNSYGSWSDIYSLGGLFSEYLTLKLWHRVFPKWAIPDHIPKQLVDLVERMCDPLPTKRPSIQQILSVLKKLNPEITPLHLNKDVIYNICSFLHPETAYNKLGFQSRYHYELMNNHDGLWQFWCQKFHYIGLFETKSWNSLEYGYKTFRDLFISKNMTIKAKSRNVTISKDLRSVSCDLLLDPMTNKFATTRESVSNQHKAVIRIKYHTSQNGCFIGILASNRINECLQDEKDFHFHKFIRIMRDGSVGGMRMKQQKEGEKISRTKLFKDRDGIQKMLRVFYRTMENDILTIHVDPIGCRISLIVNDEINSLMILSDLQEFTLGDTYQFIFGLTALQKWTILDNIVHLSELDTPKRKVVHSVSV